MGKKFLICEVEPDGEGFRPITDEALDQTWIDPRHVIDGDDLNIRIPKGGEKIFAPEGGWVVAADWDEYSITYLILDPPKAEGDEWETWANDCPLLLPRADRLELAEWVSKMSRKP